MIIEQHYDEEVLIGLLEEADHDSHVPGCETCAGTLESLRDLTGALRDNSVWDERQLSETPSPKTTNMLRAFAERTRAEDAAAAAIVPRLIAAPAEERAALLDRNPQWRTAGVVRRLLAHVDSINYTNPKGAVVLSRLSAEIAESIDDGSHPLEALLKLRAAACREYAWALYFVGSFPESVTALDRADRHLADSKLAESDAAEIKLLRARVYRDLERLDEALPLARQSCVVFLLYGNRIRAGVAEAIEATVLVHLRRFREALAIDLRIAADASLDDESRASALNRAAYSLRELSSFDEAKKRYAQAIGAFERLGLSTKRAMARWGFGRVLLDEGRAYESALALFTELRGELEELGLAHDLALVSLDAAETLIALNRPKEVGELCHSALEYFGKSSLTYSSSAMTALAYLREVAESGKLTPTAVRHVRTYFEVLPKQPNLLFAFPA
jgi:tetratricopeptide (TPR) repeat protein